MMKNIWNLIGIYYQLQNINTVLLRRLSDGYMFLDPGLNEI